MPTPFPEHRGVRLSRRAVLSAMAVSLSPSLLACTAEPRQRREDPAPVEPEVDADVALAAEALTQQRTMIDLISASQERHPRLARLLGPLLTAHDAHASLLAEAAPDDESEQPSPSATPESDRRTRVARNPARAVDDLVRAERALVVATKRHAFRARSGAFARVLAGMAAAAAQNATLLESASAPGRRSS